MHFRILSFVSGLPIVDHSVTQRLVCPGEHGVLGYGTLQLLELVLDFFALGLFFIEFGLEFRSHPVVTFLGLLQIETDLMDVSQSVQVLVLGQHLFSLHIGVSLIVVVLDDARLQVLVSPLQRLILPELICDRSNELLTDLPFFRQIVQVILTLRNVLIIFTLTFFLLLTIVLSAAFHATATLTVLLAGAIATRATLAMA